MPNPYKNYELLLQEHGCSRRIIDHCRAVTSCALELSNNCPFIDRSLVEAGGMLHDIGRGNTHSIGHAQAGADLCRALGFPEAVARIVECHTGAGLTADECSLLKLLPRPCIPETAEERLIAHADNLVAGKRRVTMYDTLASAIHLSKKTRRRMYRLALDVEILCNQ